MPDETARLPRRTCQRELNTGVLDDWQAAFSAAAAPEHTVDRVEAITGPVEIPITGC